MIHAAQALRNKRPLQGNPAVVAAAATAAHMNLTPHADTTQCKATQPSNASACTTSSTKGSRWFGAPYRSTTTRAAPSSHPPLMALQNDGGGGMAGRGAAMVVLNTSGGGDGITSGDVGDEDGDASTEATPNKQRRQPRNPTVSAAGVMAEAAGEGAAPGGGGQRRRRRRCQR